jgi:hypothetical protein
LAEIRLKTVERAQLNLRHRFWSNIVQVGRKISKLAEFHPNRRRKNQPGVEFRPTWTIFDQNRGGNLTARVLWTGFSAETKILKSLIILLRKGS